MKKMMTTVNHFCSAPQWRLRLFVSMLAVIILIGCARPHQFTGLIFDDPKPAAEIVGVDQNGEPFRLSDHRGELMLIFFGYTYCPDICPMTLGEISRAYNQLAAENPNLAQDLSVVFISVDPERDTAERLAEYVPAFHPDFYGVYVDPDDLEKVKLGYGVYAQKSEGQTNATNYTVDHTSGIYLVDQEGNWKGLFKTDIASDALLADLQALLQS